VLVHGLVPGEGVTVVAVRCAGSASAVVTYRTTAVKVDEQVVYQHQEPDLVLSEAASPLVLRRNPKLFRLAAGPAASSWAHLFDDRLAVRLSLIEPLPHQISAVYGEMPPRQPLRCCLADDAGVGKTMMAGLYIKELLLRAFLRSSGQRPAAAIRRAYFVRSRIPWRRPAIPAAGQPRLRQDFSHGDQYYAQAGKVVDLPDRRVDRPGSEFLEWHLVFKAS
jgi:hypothetical protein